MQVQIHTDNHIEGSEAMAKWASGAISGTLERVRGHITRVEAHLSDSNAGKKAHPASLQCTLEARLEGHQPLVVKHQADNMNQAISGAAEKLLRLVDSTLERGRP